MFKMRIKHQTELAIIKSEEYEVIRENIVNQCGGFGIINVISIIIKWVSFNDTEFIHM